MDFGIWQVADSTHPKIRKGSSVGVQTHTETVRIVSAGDPVLEVPVTQAFLRIDGERKGKFNLPGGSIWITSKSIRSRALLEDLAAKQTSMEQAREQAAADLATAELAARAATAAIRARPALIACPACQHQVSNQATACPSCGHPVLGDPTSGRVQSGGIISAQRACDHPECDESDGLERCAEDRSRLVCAVHRTLRGGSFVCQMCDDESAQAERRAVVDAEAARRQSFHKVLLLGSIGSIVVMTALVFGSLAGSDGRLIELLEANPDVQWLVLLVPAGIVAAAGLILTEGFRVGRVADLPGPVALLVWICALPGILAFSFLLVALLLTGSWVSREASINRDAEAVRRGVNRALDDR